ncbi:MAG TPA: hypothetical protein VLT58_05390 [Polyangia bacterium]|nr:hypothetical protein [Polyangia bacterium]
MVRKSCFVLGIGLAILWWVGLSENQSATVLWFDAVAAVLSFGMAAHQPIWASWLNFVFALGFMGVATSAALGTRWAHSAGHPRDGLTARR